MRARKVQSMQNLIDKIRSGKAKTPKIRNSAIAPGHHKRRPSYVSHHFAKKYTKAVLFACYRIDNFGTPGNLKFDDGIPERVSPDGPYKFEDYAYPADGLVKQVLELRATNTYTGGPGKRLGVGLATGNH